MLAQQGLTWLAISGMMTAKRRQPIRCSLRLVGSGLFSGPVAQGPDRLLLVFADEGHFAHMITLGDGFSQAKFEVLELAADATVAIHGDVA